MAASDPTNPQYGRYSGQSYAQQEYEPPYASPSPQGVDTDFADVVAERVVQRLREDKSGKIYPQTQSRDKNILRIVIAFVSILLFFPFAFLFLIMVGGTAGWISFAGVGFTIFVLSLVTLDKIK